MHIHTNIHTCVSTRTRVRHTYKPPPPHLLQHTHPLTPPHSLTLGMHARAHTHTHTHTHKSGWLPIHVQFVGLSHELVKISQFFVREMVVRRKVGADTLKDLRIDCFRGHAVPEGALVDAVLAK